MWARIRNARRLLLELRAIAYALFGPAERTRPPHEPTVPAREAKRDHVAHLDQFHRDVEAADDRRDALRPPPIPRGNGRGN